ncbi:hypothetical protein OE766_26125 [Pararhizobium sp. YC-54]|uniref:hypothetical protein n=1 Tax=Pararhizobium sp. YC-54 TaxID=2986920 RepID=UPI0021F6F97D|nr:hypothetical protein [Pararhizobium sp. YC-54]MCW0001702.1 hypothetical protein [Pararhizobium sp. YC-54]
MGNDMERDRLASQHGHYSYQVRAYDDRVAERKAQEDAQRWNDYRNAAERQNQQTFGWENQGGSGNLGEALAKLFSAGCVLLLLYAVWRFAVEATHALWTVWGHLFYAVAHPFGAGHAFLIACFALSWLALWTALRRVPLYRALRPWARTAAFLVAVAPSQILLWLTGTLLLTLPTAGLLLEPAYVRIAENLPGMVRMAADVAKATLASMLVVVGVPLTQLVWRTIDRLALSTMTVGLSISKWLTERRLASWAGIALATLLMLLLFAAPKPPLAMPLGIWTYSALVIGALFGWRIALVAALLATLLAQPGYGEEVSMFADGTALQRISLWWAGLAGAGAAAGFLRPALPSRLGGEVRMAVLATLIGLGTGCLTMLLIEAANFGPDRLTALAIDYWTHPDFVPGFLPGYAASAAIGALASLVIRNAGHLLARRATAA